MVFSRTILFAGLSLALLSAMAIPLLGQAEAATGAQGTATVKAVTLSGTMLHMWTVVRSASTTTQTGFTPLSIAGSPATTYTVTVADYGQYIFDHWENGSTSRTRSVALNADSAMTAYYRVQSIPADMMSSRGLAFRVHELVNGQRAAAGLSPLAFDSKLSLIAESHSNDMAANNYFSHVNREGQGPLQRAQAAGYYCGRGFAENILQNWIFAKPTFVNGVAMYDRAAMEKLAHDSVQMWMGSAGHKSNILNTQFPNEGVGVAITSQGKVYVTEDFC